MCRLPWNVSCYLCSRQEQIERSALQIGSGDLATPYRTESVESFVTNLTRSKATFFLLTSLWLVFVLIESCVVLYLYKHKAQTRHMYASLHIRSIRSIIVLESYIWKRSLLSVSQARVFSNIPVAQISWRFVLTLFYWKHLPYLAEIKS